MALEDVETGALEEFRELQRQVERGEWIINPSPPGWRCRRKKAMGKVNLRTAAALGETTQAEKTWYCRDIVRRR